MQGALDSLTLAREQELGACVRFFARAETDNAAIVDLATSPYKRDNGQVRLRALPCSLCICLTVVVMPRVDGVRSIADMPRC